MDFVGSAGVAPTAVASRPVTEAFWAALDLWRPLVGYLWNPASPFARAVANYFPQARAPWGDLMDPLAGPVETVVAVLRTYCC